MQETNIQTDIDPLTELLDVDGVSRMLSVSPRTVRHMVLKRKIPYVKIGKLLRFHVGVVRSWYKGKMVQPVGHDIITRML
jgi:excisionase family DNA binding protein